MERMRALASIALVMAACGGSSEVAIDATRDDAAAPDDARAVDAGPPDAVDAEPPDAGHPHYCESSAGCHPDDYCLLNDPDFCDSIFFTGTCQPRPDSCAPDPQPACGCDGVTYPSGCDANAAGAVAGPGACPAIADHFLCGDRYCPLGTHYCDHRYVAEDQPHQSWSCEPVPDHAGDLCAHLIDTIDCPFGTTPEESCAGTDEAGVTYYCRYGS